MDQWRERLSTFLNLDKKNIGIVGGGKDNRTGIVDIAVIQSLNQKGNAATPTRQDGHQPIVLMQCGPIRIKIDPKSQAQAQGIEHKSN